MSKLRLFYIASLVILGVLLVFAVFRPLATGSEYSEVQREQLLQTENGYIIQFAIINHEGDDGQYTINVSFDNYQFSQDVLIPDGEMFIYAHHIHKDQITEENVNLAIYKEGEPTPFEQVTYYLN
jgi:hypothetical protein